ncbi:MAG TPA: hypothetical protein VHT91_20725 [Kofleriaceae bacterium]|jgi:hypothetical protein|nr:hypothetical protein [Kofleriaceae bacterium]
MSVQYSYTHAAKRLLSDAVVLWAGGARETAVHLAGLSAECALKSVLVGLGLVAVGTDGQITNRSLRLHIDKLFGQFQALLQGHQGAMYAALLPTPVPQPFHDWLVDHRYVADRQFSSQAFERWMWAAIVISKILNEAERKTPREAQ